MVLIYLMASTAVSPKLSRLETTAAPSDESIWKVRMLPALDDQMEQPAAVGDGLLERLAAGGFAFRSWSASVVLNE